MQEAKSATFPLVMVPHFVGVGSWGLCRGSRVGKLNLCHALGCPWVGSRVPGAGLGHHLHRLAKRDTGKPVLIHTVKPVLAEIPSVVLLPGGHGEAARGAAKARQCLLPNPPAGTLLPRPSCRRQGGRARGLCSGTGHSLALGTLAVARAPFWHRVHRQSSGSVGSAGACCVHCVPVSAGAAALTGMLREPLTRGRPVQPLAKTGPAVRSPRVCSRSGSGRPRCPAQKPRVPPAARSSRPAARAQDGGAGRAGARRGGAAGAMLGLREEPPPPPAAAAAGQGAAIAGASGGGAEPIAVRPGRAAAAEAPWQRRRSRWPPRAAPAAAAGSRRRRRYCWCCYRSCCSLCSPPGWGPPRRRRRQAGGRQPAGVVPPPCRAGRRPCPRGCPRRRAAGPRRAARPAPPSRARCPRSQHRPRGGGAGAQHRTATRCSPSTTTRRRWRRTSRRGRRWWR